MTTKRRRIAPRRIGQDVPPWAQALLEGRMPEDDVGKDGLIDWLYFHEAVPGLPPADSPEGTALWAAAKEPTSADEA